MGLKQFAAEIIEGPGGLNDFIEREMVVYSVSDKVFAAEWAIKCLANPQCKGSDVAVTAILKRRGVQDEPDAMPSLRAALAASEAKRAELEGIIKDLRPMAGECTCSGTFHSGKWVRRSPLCLSCRAEAALLGEEVQG